MTTLTEDILGAGVPDGLGPDDHIVFAMNRSGHKCLVGVDPHLDPFLVVGDVRISLDDATAKILGLSLMEI